MELIELILGAGAKEAGNALAKFAMETWKAGFFHTWSLEAAERAAGAYSHRFAEHHGQIKVLGMYEPVPVKEIYTSVRVVHNTLPYSSREEMERVIRRDGGRAFCQEREASRPGIEVANEKQFLNVMGGPGAGKSTFLRRIGLEALLHRRDGLASILPQRDRPYRHRLLPVFIEMKTAKFKTLNLLTLVQEEFDVCGFPKSFAEDALAKGKLLLLLDGLDEVPVDKVDETISHIRQFVDKFDKNRFITSCRTAFYKAFFTRFTDVVLTDFNDNQVENFVKNWFRSKEDIEQQIAKGFLRTLRRAENQATLDLARTPLLLTFLCLVQDDRQNLPSTRSSLYKFALEILLEKWAAQKRIHQEPIYTDNQTNASLKTDLEIVMLSKIAGDAFLLDKLFFSRDELVDAITQFLQDTLNAPKHLDGRQVLDDIEIRQGLLVQRAHDIYSFSHLTLQEYLAACYHVNPRRMVAIIDGQFFNARWREVFLLMVGMDMVDADDLLHRMVTRCKRFVMENPVVREVLNWAEKVTNAEGTAEMRAGRRSAILFFAVTLNLTLARDKARDMLRTGVKDQEIHQRLQDARDFAYELSVVRDLAANLALALTPAMSGIIGPAIERDMARAWDLGLDVENDGGVNLGLALVDASRRKVEKRKARPQLDSVSLGDALTLKEKIAKIVTDTPLDVSNLHSLLDSERELDIGTAIEHVQDLKKSGIFSGGLEDLEKLLRSMQIPRRGALWIERMNFSKTVASTVQSHLAISFDMQAWSIVNVRALVNYLYGMVLLLKAKEEALNLSSTAWVEISTSVFADEL